MGFFDKILEKIGIKKKEEKVIGGEAKGGMKAKDDVVNAPARTVPQQAGVINPAPVSVVDVVAKLEGLAKGKDLNWKVSIVDLLKLLDLDSSREAREELAKELNAPADVTGDSARLNTWLHKEVLRKIAANGGNIPKELLD
jgi:hypothetical protein